MLDALSMDSRSNAALARIAALLAALISGACARAPSVMAPAQPVFSGPAANDPFSHSMHLPLVSVTARGTHPCAVCHTPDPARGFTVVRPGGREHAPCDSCHAEAFFKAPGEICAVCHDRTDPLHPGASPLKEYPRRQEKAVLISAFSHRAHLVGANVRDGKGVACTACHHLEPGGSVYAGFPRHAECSGCHGNETSGVHPQMSECARCHDRDGPGRVRHFLRNDVRFTHAKHTVDASGAPIVCQVCHQGMERSASSQELVLPEMRACTTCHSDPARTPAAARMTRCGLCHASGKDAVALPGDHTP